MRSEVGLERRVHLPGDSAFPRHLSSASSSALKKQGAFTGLWQSLAFLWKSSFPPGAEEAGVAGHGHK